MLASKPQTALGSIDLVPKDGQGMAHEKGLHQACTLLKSGRAGPITALAGSAVAQIVRPVALAPANSSPIRT